ncbi:hypothetical protein [Flavobacterium silvaticum]|uniref:Outer membrane protein beta-barrel domain-containing protein n=1 Tax=Flavobacterium silvaticum TaxID=1852020 RepID=A0A972FWD0_9FLAO|nr:hypothetical protein [Flavobacterium silvaticum]NMH29242.1 hypothetical protein [Flavobacterium silvaticum]
MKHFLLLTVLIGFSCYGQIAFEPGYYINNQNQKVEGWIKNSDWLNNPESIEFKSSETAQSTTIDKSEIQEFSVGEVHRYKRFYVKVDTSATNSNDLTVSPAPEWREESALLKALATGKSALYYYRDHGLTRYFFSKEPHDHAEQLVYKEYKGNGQQVFQNNAYKQQLLQLFLADGLTVPEINAVDYQDNQLIALFVRYGAVELKEKKEAGKSGNPLHLNVSVGASFFGNDFHDGSRERNVSASGTSFLPQLEMEYVFNFNRHKWSMFVGAGYQDAKVQDNGNLFEYSFVPIPVGVRHSMFVGKESKITIEAGFSLNIALDSKLSYVYSQYSSPQFDISNSTGVFIGGGFTWKSFSLGVRYNLKRDILNYNSQSSKFSATDVFFKYRLF